MQKGSSLIEAMQLAERAKAVASRYRVNNMQPPGGDTARLLEELAEALLVLIRNYSDYANNTSQRIAALLARIENLERQPKL